MAAEDDGKTEEPTGKKLSQARDEGHVPLSQEVKTAAVLLAVTVVVWLMVPTVMVRAKGYLARFLEQPHSIRVSDEASAIAVVRDAFTHAALLIVIPLAFLLLVGLIAAVGQTGWMFVTKRITPDLNKINPLTGLQRMFSLMSVVELAKSIAKMVVVAALFYMILRPRIDELELLPSMDIMSILSFLHHILIRLLFAIVAVEVLIAAGDWFYQRYSFMQKQRMTKQEVKDEHKQTEGDPMIKSRLRSLRMQRARQRMMAAVPKADVVVTNPTHYACALKYDSDTMNAPVLVAKGKNLIALRIRELAEENDVPIVENPPLARALFASVELDREVSPEHYKAVAEVISYVFRLKGKFRR